MRITLISLLVLLWYEAHAQISKVYEDYIDFNKIEGCDSVIVTNKTGLREMVVRYRNGRLDNISYIDTLTARPIAWKYFKYSDRNQIEQAEFKECWGIDDRTRNVKEDCAYIYTFYTKKYTYDSNNRIKDEIFLWYNRGVPEDSVINRFQYLKQGLIIESTGKSPRKVEIEFDKLGRLISKTEMNSHGEVYYFSKVDFKNRHKAVVTLKMYRDSMDDIPFPERVFRFEITFNNKNLPTVFENDSTKHYFNYY